MMLTLLPKLASTDLCYSDKFVYIFTYPSAQTGCDAGSFLSEVWIQSLPSRPVPILILKSPVYSSIYP